MLLILGSVLRSLRRHLESFLSMCLHAAVKRGFLSCIRVCVCFGRISIRHTSQDSYNILSQGEDAGLSSKGPGEVL